MKLGLHIAATTWQGGAAGLGPTLVEVVEAAEAAGFDAIGVTDHVWQHPFIGGPEQTRSRRTPPSASSPPAPAGCAC